MKINIEIEVKRNRWGVTQGSRDLYINGEAVATGYYDNIQRLKDGDTYYGEEWGGWASINPDSSFICELVTPRYEPEAAEALKRAFRELDDPHIYHKPIDDNEEDE